MDFKINCEEKNSKHIIFSDILVRFIWFKTSGHWPSSICLYVYPGGTLSATRASSRASSRSGCTSGTLEESRRESRRGASRAGAARTAAILLISRHLKAVRDGGAHPKCAAKGDPDDVRGPVCTFRADLLQRITLDLDISCYTTPSYKNMMYIQRWKAHNYKILFNWPFI